MRGEVAAEKSRGEHKPLRNVNPDKPPSKDRKKFKCPEMKYNKFQMYDLNKDGQTSNFANHNSAANDAVSPDKSPIHLHQSVESDVKEIRRYLRQLIGRLNEKDIQGRISAEWRVVALVLDRLFFFTYLMAIVISLATIFPKTN